MALPMIFLGVSEQTRKALSRTLTRAFQRSHPDDPNVLCQLIGGVLLAIGIYLAYKWLSSSEPRENPPPEQPASTSSEHAIFAVVFLGLGAFFLILGAPANPASKGNLPGANKASEIDTLAARRRDKQGRPLETFDTRSFKLRRPEAYRLPKLADPTSAPIWLDRLELPKLAKGMPAGAPWAQRLKLVHEQNNLVEVDGLFYDLEYHSSWSRINKASSAKPDAADGDTTKKDGGKSGGK